MYHKVKLGDLQITNEGKEYINDILATNRVSYGKYSVQLEEEIATLHDASYGVLSNSGTSSLQVALHALKIENNWPDGAEVIVPATTFVATINIILQNNLKPVFVDINPYYYDIDTNQIEKAITANTVAMIPVNLFGQTCDLVRIKELATKYKLKTILDSCEAIGVGHNYKPLMYYVDIICFSFYVAHIIQGGVGGISITNDSKLANLMRSLVNHGRRPTYITIDDKPVNLTDRFTFDYPGYSYRITEFESALALSNLHCIDRILLQRQYNAHELKQGLSSYQSKLQLPFIRLESEHSWMMFPIIILDNTNKLVLCNFLEEHGIETRDMLPLIEQPIANKYYGILDTNKYPVSMNLINKGFYISCSDHLNNTDICHIIKTFEEFYYV